LPAPPSRRKCKQLSKTGKQHFVSTNIIQA
jgi:hypothetical protein